MQLLFDENFNQRILRGLKLEIPNLDYKIVQDVGLKGKSDPEVLHWASENGRILVTHDLKTIPKFGYQRITKKQYFSGVIAVSSDFPIGQAIDELAIVVKCSKSNDFENQILYLPI
jgi:Domain of unknown function (DUF5615)